MALEQVVECAFRACVLPEDVYMPFFGAFVVGGPVWARPVRLAAPGAQSPFFPLSWKDVKTPSRGRPMHTCSVRWRLAPLKQWRREAELKRRTLVEAGGDGWVFAPGASLCFRKCGKWSQAHVM